MEWLGHAKIEFTHAPSPRAVKAKNGEDTDLLKIAEKTTPPCQLNPLLANGHLQTMWTATKLAGPPVYYRRKLFKAEEEAYHGTFAVDFVVEPFEESDQDLPPRTVYFGEEEFVSLGSDDSKPMLVVLHGLSGGSHEIYLRHAIAPLIGEGGWEACVVNSRGCAGSKITSSVLYNARATWDVRQVVKFLRKTFPKRPLFGLGFSLGANMLTNYCGEEGANCLLKAAVVCSNPFNLEVSSKMLQNSFIGKEVYLRYMGDAMKRLIDSHHEELKKFTNLDLDAVKKVTYLNEFDREVQIPFLAVQATDDPIAVKEALPYEEFRQNPNTILLTTSLGGHLCWFETGGGRWHARAVPAFLNELAFNTDLTSLEPTQEEATTVRLDRGSTYDPMRRKLAVVHNAKPA